MNSPRTFAALLGLVFLMCVPSALAQVAPPGPLTPVPGVQPEQPPPGKQKPSIRVRVNEVTAPVAVLDRSGEMVFNLTQKDFRVFDNGAEQKIEHFDLGGDALSIVLAVETSSRIEPLLPAMRQTGIVFSQTVMARTAEAAVIGFDDTVDLLDKFTTDPDSVENKIEHLRMGTSGVLLYDAMARGVSLLAERPDGPAAHSRGDGGSAGYRQRKQTRRGAATGTTRECDDLLDWV